MGFVNTFVFKQRDIREDIYCSYVVKLEYWKEVEQLLWYNIDNQDVF